jgi:hypothetical protein
MAPADNLMHAYHFTSQNSVISNILQTEEDKAALHQHVHEIVEGRAFRGSERSIRFLEFVIDKAIAGDLDSLKERLIGIELFGRSPTYSTSKDAIVRVTASDVRKRLLGHYGWYGRTSKFQINLPTRTYVPEISAVRLETHGLKGNDDSLPSPSSHESGVAAVDIASVREGFLEVASVHPHDVLDTGLNARKIVFYGALAAILMASLWMLGSHYVRSKIATAHAMSHLALPWQVFIESQRPVQIVTSDRGLVEVEALVHKPITVSQYANHTYVPDADHLKADVVRLCNEILVSNRAAAVDIPIVVGITELAQTNSQMIAVRMARELQIQDLNSDNNFVFLGSPRSNPWVALFEDQMDFRFQYDQDGNEFIEDVHPHPDESNLPKRMTASDGRTYGIVAFLPNPYAHGSSVILSGLDIEGTQAAGKLITDLPRLSAILRDCGVGQNGASPYFELLLHPKTIAGASTNTEVAACHRIQPRTD